MLVCVNPQDSSRWLNGNSCLYWQEKAPADHSQTDVACGELGYIINAYLIRMSDADAFLEWAERVDFAGGWIPEPPDVTGMFFGEHGWSPASRYFQNSFFGYRGWTQPDQDSEIKLCQVAVECLQESGFDCSVDDGYTLRLPARELMTNLGLYWTGHGADFATSSGQVVALDPTASAPGPTMLLLREDALLDLQKREQITLCWAVFSEKRMLNAGSYAPYPTEIRQSGAFVLDGTKIRGFMKRMLDERNAGDPTLRLIDTYRTSP
jgi:hypothetical protein